MVSGLFLKPTAVMEEVVLSKLRTNAKWFFALVALAGCSGGQLHQESPNNTVLPASESSASSEPPPRRVADGELTEDQKEQMRTALQRGGRAANECNKILPNAMPEGGEGEVTVIFDGQKGRVSDVEVGQPMAGTVLEACVKRAFLNEVILPFEGDPIEAKYTLTLAPAKNAETEATSTDAAAAKAKAANTAKAKVRALDIAMAEAVAEGTGETKAKRMNMTKAKSPDATAGKAQPTGARAEP
jgi:hypothetical protein